MSAVPVPVGVTNVHPYVNDMFVRYYAPRFDKPYREVKFSNHHVYKLPKLVLDMWCLGKEQAILDCMILGYSLCVVVPLVNRIHDQMDASYAAYCAEQEEHAPTNTTFL